MEGSNVPNVACSAVNCHMKIEHLGNGPTVPLARASELNAYSVREDELYERLSKLAQHRNPGAGGGFSSYTGLIETRLCQQ